MFEFFFEDNMFDGVIMMYVVMNIENWDVFYIDVVCVIKFGGVFGVFDVMKGLMLGMIYLVFWVEMEEMSFLKFCDEIVIYLDWVGFDVIVEKNLFEFVIEFFEVNVKCVVEGGLFYVGL